MKPKLVYWLLIILFTILPIALESGFREGIERLSTFLWSLFLIPNILIMVMYPKWKIIIGSAFFYSLLKYAAEFSEEVPTHDKIELILLIAGSIVNGAILFTIGYFILKNNKLLKYVQKLTIIDSLTGLYNRRYFDLYMEKAVPISERSSLVLIMLDIDHFKRINDQFGHQCGDEALKHIAEIIRCNVRKSDGYVRFGGEEFAVILPNTDVGKGEKLAERIREVVEQSHFIYKDKQIRFTISIGIATYSGEETEEFIEKADKALYHAKEDGRNRVAIFNAS
ncbi:GGDEF domain-containing protein [Bacillus sp. FJAT-29814]|uniref:GGDEF domain-containing protein n=1 Tax=Bacillus sp. FJAT-29814 TaxID=1729688 RepID=UPI001560A815|nr:GGDEF domain-containing protein [Bacillus sp. FJAT-29814]